MVDINFNSWDSSSYHFYGIVNQGWSGSLYKQNNGFLLSNISADNYNLIKLDSNLLVQWHVPTPYASKGSLLIDSLNNMEQVTIDNPNPGAYTLTVEGHSVPFGVQNIISYINLIRMILLLLILMVAKVLFPVKLNC